jgi:hypothetical protein
MKYWCMSLLLICLVSCGRSDDSQNAAGDDPQRVADQAAVEAQEMVDRAVRGEKEEPATEGLEGCNVFDSGLVLELFEVDASIVTYDRSIPVKRAGHVVCSARWDKPNKEELDKAYSAAMMEWATSQATGKKKPQPKYPSVDSRVSLTLSAGDFDSADDAVASLESTVATLSKGVSFEVGGQQHETKMSFGDWINGVGDKAVFSDNGELLIAYDAKRMAVSVHVMGDEAKDREKAIELAQRIIDRL